MDYDLPMQPIRSILGDLLPDWTISRAAKEAKLMRRCMRGLWGKKEPRARSAVQFETMRKIYDAFGLRPGDWLVHHRAGLPVLIAGHGGRVRVVLGEYQVRLARRPGFHANPFPEDVTRKATDMWDTRALVEIARRSPVNPEIAYCGYSLHLPRRDVRNGDALPESLRSLKSGVLVSLGSPLSSAYADYTLANIEAAGWDVPITFHWGCDGEGSRVYSRFGTARRGIAWRGELIEVPSWRTIAGLQAGTQYDDVAAILLQRVPGIKSLVILVMGLMGPATYAAARFLFSEEFGRRSASYRRDVASAERPEPYFSLWKVPCTTRPTALEVVPGIPRYFDSLGPRDYR